LEANRENVVAPVIMADAGEISSTGPVKLFFQCLLAVFVFLILLIKLIILSPILILSLASVIIRTIMALIRKSRGATE
jgi:hypothetical protein